MLRRLLNFFVCKKTARTATTAKRKYKAHLSRKGIKPISVKKNASTLSKPTHKKIHSFPKSVSPIFSLLTLNAFFSMGAASGAFRAVASIGEVRRKVFLI